PPADANNSRGSAEAPPQCSEPGAATEQSVSAQASPRPQPWCSQQARLSVVSSPPRSSPPHPARAREPRSPLDVAAALPPEPPLSAAQSDAIPAASFQESLWPHRQGCEPS